MGLDMYLERHVFVWRPEKLLLKGINVNPKKVTKIIETAIYWRKANQIHGWFVKKCQDGVDDCDKHYVDRKKLEELKKTCDEVLKHPKKAAKLLPPTPGFFFGETEINDYYFEQVKRTNKELAKILKKKNDEGVYYYRSSW
jgi:hypothetical protein